VKLPIDALIATEKLTKYLLVKRPVGDKSEFLRQAVYPFGLFSNYLFSTECFSEMLDLNILHEITRSPVHRAVTCVLAKH